MNLKKRLIPLILLSALALTSCASAPATDSPSAVENSAQPAASQGSEEITEDEIRSLIELDRRYERITRLADFSWGESDITDIDPEAETFYKVTEPGLEKFSDFEDLVRSTYTENVAEYYIWQQTESENRIFKNVNGDLYFIGAGGAGTDTSEEFFFEILSSSPTEAEADVHRPYIFDDEQGEYETRRYFFRRESSGWRIANGDVSGIEIPESAVSELLEKERFILEAINGNGFTLPSEQDISDGKYSAVTNEFGDVFYPVLDENFDGWDEWQSYVESVYGEDLARETLMNGTVIKSGDKTYAEKNAGSGAEESAQPEWKQLLSGSDEDPEVWGTVTGDKKTVYRFKETAAGWRIEWEYPSAGD